ncbi:MAG: hypothetical protein R3A79_31240 [Nannocystaceae bacterium]
MGVTLHRFYLSPPSVAGSPHLLVRVVRPAAPNAAQPAVDFADDLAQAKAEALQEAWHAAVGGEGPPPAPLGQASPDLDADEPEDRPLLAHHGGELDLWWTPSERHAGLVAIGPGAQEADFWRWLDGFLSEREIAALRRPAQAIRARLVTEAELRFVDAPLLLVDDVDWLTAAEFRRLNRGGGLAEAIAAVPRVLEAVPAEAILAAKRALIERALAADLAAADRRAAAFRASDLARLDPAAALALVARLVDAIEPGDDRRGIAWALAYALALVDPGDARAALLERLETAGGDFAAALLRELRGIVGDAGR